MAQRIYSTGSQGSFFYDDAEVFPSPQLRDTLFPKQIAFLGEGTIGMLSRTTPGTAIGRAAEVHEPPNLLDGEFHLFNQRIQASNTSKLKLVFNDRDTYGEVIIQNESRTNINNIVDIVVDLDGEFGLGAGTSTFNFVLDSNNDVTFENNSGTSIEWLIFEESFNFQDFVTP